MRLTTPATLLALSALATHLLAAPLPAAGDGPATITAPLIDNLIGSDNVNAIDAIADVGGFSQYGSGDNAEDSNALPQQTAENFIGADGAVTTTLEGLPVKAKRGAFGDALAQELVDANGDFDQVGASLDQVANNVLGVCDENTTAPEAECDAVTTDKTSTRN